MTFQSVVNNPMCNILKRINVFKPNNSLSTYSSFNNFH